MDRTKLSKEDRDWCREYFKQQGWTVSRIWGLRNTSAGTAYCRWCGQPLPGRDPCLQIRGQLAGCHIRANLWLCLDRDACHYRVSVRTP